MMVIMQIMENSFIERFYGFVSEEVLALEPADRPFQSERNRVLEGSSVLDAKKKKRCDITLSCKSTQRV